MHVMGIMKIYIENSVIGGYFDKEFMHYTHKLFECFLNKKYKPVISSHVIAELDDGAPDYVKDILRTIDYDEYIVNEEMISLAEKYISDKIVSETYYSDALHIAVATIIGVDVLVSWNFKHIVNLDIIILFNAINIQEGYSNLEIRSPREVVENE